MTEKTNFEIFLEKSRYLIIIPVVSLLFSSLFIFIWTLWSFFSKFKFTDQNVIIKLISAFDLFLLGVIALVFAVSLYELYIKEPEKNSKLPSGLIVSSLDELKDKMAKIVYLILLITFFKFALTYKYETIESLLVLSVAIFFISLSLYFTNSKLKK